MAGRFWPVRWAAAVALTATVAGCVTVRGPDSALTVNRARWVQMSIGQDMSVGALGAADLTGIVADDGGGYVTRITITGRRGTFRQRIVMDVVLGTSVVRNPPEGGAVNSGANVAQVVLCFQFTIGWVDTMVPRPVQKSCPESAVHGPALAAGEAGKIQAAANLAAVVGTPRSAVPGSRAAAVTLLKRRGTYALKVLANEGAGQPVTAAGLAGTLGRLSFATGDGLAAVAIPVPGGGCVYESFTRGDPPGGANQVWPAPLDNPCTAAAALALSGPLSYDPQAGG
jgi:hypothetical protein